MEKENKATKDTRREHAGCTILLFKFYCPLFQQCTPEVGAASARGMQEKRQLNAFIAVAAALTLGVGYVAPYSDLKHPAEFRLLLSDRSGSVAGCS